MAKRYKLLDEAWDVVADLFTPTNPETGREGRRLDFSGFVQSLGRGSPPWREVTLYHERSRQITAVNQI